MLTFDLPRYPIGMRTGGSRGEWKLVRAGPGPGRPRSAGAMEARALSALRRALDLDCRSASFHPDRACLGRLDRLKWAVWTTTGRGRSRSQTGRTPVAFPTGPRARGAAP